MGGSVRRRLWLRGTLLAGLAVMPLVALACTPSGGGGGGGGVTFVPTTTSTTLPWTDPVGFKTDFTMNCSVYVAGSYHTFTQSASVIVDAPDFVSQGETFYITIAPGTWVVPSDIQGYSVDHIGHFAIAFLLSPNVEFVDSVMTAGINMGPGYPSLSVADGMMTYQVPGPFQPAGTVVQMPAVRLQLKATGAPGSRIDTKMAWLRNVATFPAGSVGNLCTLVNPTQLFGTTWID
jgi:hypothetical protein